VLLALEGEEIACDGEFKILLIEARQLGRDRDVVAVLGEIDARRGTGPARQ